VPRAILTDTFLRQVQTPADYTHDYWDRTLPSFGVRVARGGTKTFVLKKDNKRHVIGRYPIVTLKQAREEARRRLALKYFPQPTISTAQAIEEYLAHQQTRIRPSSYTRFKLHLARDFPEQRLTALTPQNIYAALKDLSPSQANLAFTVFKAFLNWCLERQYVDKHPLQRAKQPHKTASRDRVLSDPEITTILRATDANTPFNNIVQFLVYSAQVATLQRTYIDYKDLHITWPKEEMKAGISHTIPLTDKLRKLVHRGPVGLYAFGTAPFRDWDRAKKDLDARVTLPHWTLHDLRRTARTNLARSEYPRTSLNEFWRMHPRK
jgi:hypothetical protein